MPILIENRIIEVVGDLVFDSKSSFAPAMCIGPEIVTLGIAAGSFFPGPLPTGLSSVDTRQSRKSNPLPSARVVK